MIDLDSLGFYLVVALAGLFLLWYLAGAYVTRRRLAAGARWVFRGLDLYRRPPPGGSTASIKWLATNAFNIVLEDARSPLRLVVATVLLQSRDMLTVWLIDRLTGRRDMLMLRYDLERQPIWGLELFRQRSPLAGEARQRASDEGWPIEPTTDRSVLAAHGGGKAGDLCCELMAGISEGRWRLIRLSVRRQSPHLILAVDLPDLAGSDPLDVMRLGEHLATTTLAYSTS